jgi:hypothetical protein
MQWQRLVFLLSLYELSTPHYLHTQRSLPVINLSRVDVRAQRLLRMGSLQFFVRLPLEKKFLSLLFLQASFVTKFS